MLKPSSIEYFVSEDLKDKRGEVKLDKNCVVEVGKEMQRPVFVSANMNYDVICLLFVSVPACSRQGWKTLHVLCQNPQQNLRDKRVGPKAESGVDSR